MNGGEVWRSGLFPAIGAAAGEPAWDRSLGAGVVEHWAPAGRAWEQGWTVEDRPSGDGPLVVEVSTRGLDWHTVRNEGLVGTDELGILWSVSGVHAEDAAGRALEVGLNATASGFGLALDDDDAEYPLIIDPVYTAVGFTIADVSTIDGDRCDLDGDGFDDLIASDSGIVRVSFGHPDGFDPLRSRVFAGDSGWCLGDYTGDGLDDLGIQAGSRAEGYQIDVYAGSAGGLAPGVYASLLPRSSTMETYFGDWVVAGQDYDGDGRVEVLVRGGGTGGDTVYWYERSATSRDLASPGHSSERGDFDGDGLSDYILLDTPYFDVVTRTGSSSRYGTPSAAGDVNGDGFSDLVVRSSTRLEVYFGSVTGLAAAATRTYSHTGAVVADLNGDGYDDIVGTSSSSATGGSLYLGGATGSSSTSAGPVPYGLVGQLDADPAAEVVVYDRASYGQVRVHYSPITAPSSPDLTLRGTSTYSLSPRSISHDMNGDGLGELMVTRSGRDYHLDVYLSFVDADMDGVEVGLDCDDLDGSVGAASLPLFEDGDGDGFGAASAGLGCSASAGYSLVGGDCDDDDAAVNPSEADEPGDRLDRDCDGQVWCYGDGDGDGYTDGISLVLSVDADCADVGEHAGGGPVDCDDSSVAVSPVAIEVCDGVDNDCDALVDDDDDSRPTWAGGVWWRDGDGDGFGAGGTVQVCVVPSGWVAVGEADCDDRSAAVSPLALEVCDGVDNDCDGVLDEDDPSLDTSTMRVFYRDADSDGFGGVTIGAACAAPTGSVASGGDCDDANTLVAPGRPEDPGDGLDSDCDGREACFVDADGDGYRGDDLVSVDGVDCEALGFFRADAPSDCPLADDDGARSPGAAEVAGDGVDSNCDGLELCFSDYDVDGEAAADGRTVLSTDLACGGPGQAPRSMPRTDCDDGRADVGLRVTEQPGDGVDGDCDGMELCYVDADGDGFTAEGPVTALSADESCAGSGLSAAVSAVPDCDDSDPAVSPVAADVSVDGIDQDCDGRDGLSGDEGGGAEGSGDGAADAGAGEDGGVDGSDAGGSPSGDGDAGDGLSDGSAGAVADGDEGGSKGTGGCSHRPAASGSGLALLLGLGAAVRRRRQGGRGLASALQVPLGPKGLSV